MAREFSSAGYAVIQDNEETRQEGLTGCQCRVLVNSPRGYYRVYIGSLATGRWHGPYMVKAEYVIFIDIPYRRENAD